MSLLLRGLGTGGIQSFLLTQNQGYSQGSSGRVALPLAKLVLASPTFEVVPTRRDERKAPLVRSREAAMLISCLRS